jgi:hypothetical protein
MLQLIYDAGLSDQIMAKATSRNGSGGQTSSAHEHDAQ